MKRTEAAPTEQPSWVMLSNSIVDSMNTEIELGLTFAQIAKTTMNGETKARNLENARNAYEVVARFLATNDATDSVGIADRLSVLGQRIVEVGEAFDTGTNAKNRTYSEG